MAFIRHRQGCFDVWVADIVTGDARRISPDDGHYRIVGWAESNKLAVTFDSAARPPDLWLLSLDQRAEQVTDSRAGVLGDNPEITPEWIAYPARDGLTIHAALFRPAVEHGSPETHEEKQARAPAVLFLHGGPNFEFGDFYYPLPQILANEGYVVSRRTCAGVRDTALRFGMRISASGDTPTPSMRSTACGGSRRSHSLTRSALRWSVPATAAIWRCARSRLRRRCSAQV